MKKLLSCIFLLILSGCDFLPKPLTDKDIEQYIKAYQNIAEVSPILEKQKKESGSVTIFTCKECYSTLNDAVVKAGYDDLQQFLVADTRIHLTLKYYAYASIAKLVGEAGGEVSEKIPAEEICAIPENIQNSKDPQEMKTQCENIKIWSGYLAKISKTIYAIAEKLINDSDMAVVARHAEAIESALFNPKLVDEFRHVRGGADFDD